MDRDPGSAGDKNHRASADAPGVNQEQAAYRRAIDFAVNGDLRFLSHRDMLRMFGRAAVRAGLPISYSRGFNPHPKLQLPLPRPVGVASDVERLVITVSQPVTPEETLSDLAEQTPEGITLTSAIELAPGQKCTPVSAGYRVEVDTADCSQLQQRVATLLEPSPIRQQRLNPKTGRVREIDLRPLIEDLSIEEGFVQMRLLITAKGSAKPAEILTALGLDADAIHHRVRRTEITWQ